MKSNKCPRILGVFLFAILATSVASSAETDIYLNRGGQVFPNVMFAIDNSGSMTRQLLAAPDYNPRTVYAGLFHSSQFYLSADGKIPSSKGGLTNAPLQDVSACAFAQGALASDGFTAVRAAVAFANSADVDYAKNSWIPATKVNFSFTAAGKVKIECSDDSGRHGAQTGDGAPYAQAGGSALYSSASAQELDWDKYPYVTLLTGNYLNYKINPPANIWLTRRALQTRVISDAVKRNPEIMAGLATMYRRYRRSVGSGVITRAIKDNTVRANQDSLIRALSNAPYVGVTPLAAQLLEVLHYYYGKTPVSRYSLGPTSIARGLNKRYSSPIKYSCQKNYVISVTDGFPYKDTLVNGIFKSSSRRTYPQYYRHTRRSKCSGNCMDEIAAYMAGQDASNLPNVYDFDGDSIPDPQTVQVFPIGMEIQQSLLEKVAENAGTKSYYASNAVEFENAFNQILSTIKQSNAVSMVTATSSNDRFSKTSNREFLYTGQFVPTGRFQWRGNLKKYRYAYDADGVAYVTDSDTVNNPDISTDDGGTISTAKSYWSSAKDGNHALKGGVLDRLRSRSSASRLIRGINASGDVNVPIMRASNALSTANAAYSQGVDAAGRPLNEQTRILHHALGWDLQDEDKDGSTTDQRGAIGGIVRSSPVAIQYGGTRSEPIVVIFITTTDGVLHAIDDKTGDELWAIVMPEAYPYLARQYDDYFTSDPWWGIDGQIASRVVDHNENGIIESDDRVYLYISAGVAQRRWFMLDVSKAAQSSDQVTLVRRGKFDGSSAYWDELGFATAKMVPLSYRLSHDAPGKKRHGMLYANGWDPTAEFSYAPSNMGRGLSLYDADDGSPLWQMTRLHGGPSMAYAFATQPTTVDIDGDGYTDLIYAIDVNAQIWRFNVDNNASSTSSLITGGKLAKLGKDVDGDRRRAYKRIDAAMTTGSTGTQVFLAVGTGDRVNPLSTTDKDRLYVIRDLSAGSGEKPPMVLDDSDFYDATNNHIAEGSDSAKDTAIDAINQGAGWYIRLPAGLQKAISAPKISAGIVNFPVYQVAGASIDPCKDNSLGTGLLYRLKLLDATPATDYDGDGVLTAKDRFTGLKGAGIPGDVGFHTSPTGVATIMINREPFINWPDSTDPFKNHSPDRAFYGGAAGYWFD